MCATNAAALRWISVRIAGRTGPNTRVLNVRCRSACRYTTLRCVCGPATAVRPYDCAVPVRFDRTHDSTREVRRQPRRHARTGSLPAGRFTPRIATPRCRTSCAVPLSLPRLLRRGHTRPLFARWVARDCRVPVDYDLCRRTRHTRAQQVFVQRGCATDGRVCRASSIARCIAILDDVMTTGATVTALSRASCRRRGVHTRLDQHAR